MNQVVFNFHDVILLMTAMLCCCFAILLIATNPPKNTSNYFLAAFLVAHLVRIYGKGSEVQSDVAHWRAHATSSKRVLVKVEIWDVQAKY